MAQMATRGLKGRDRPVVLLGCDLDTRQLDVAEQLAHSWGWRLLSLAGLWGLIPSDLELSGALIDDLPDGDVATELRKRDCPAVRLGYLVHPKDHLLPAVLPDIRATGRLAAEHFVARRFKELAFVSWHASSPRAHNHALYQSFCSRASELGANVHFYDYRNEGDATLTSAERLRLCGERIGAWLRELPRPVGVFTIGDGIAMTICRMCKSDGLAVPEYAAVLGYGNGELCRLVSPSLSSIDPDKTGRVRKAMELLHGLMHGESAPEGPIMVQPCCVHERESTHVLATSDTVVAAALQYIWEHFDQDLSVARIASQIGLSERQLGRRFIQALGCSVNDELRRKRLEEAQLLLRSTDLSIADISPLVGFHSPTYLFRIFRDLCGMTPSLYRRGERFREQAISGSAS